MAKESLYTPETPHKCVFRETFNDEFSVRKNQGIPTNLTFSDGKAVYGTNGKINYNFSYKSGTFSIRLKITTGSSVTDYKFLIDFRQTASIGIGYIYILNGALLVSNGTKYLNGSTGSIVEVNTSYEIVVSGISLDIISSFVIGRIYTDLGYSFNGTIDLVEIYEGTLTDEEVSNLYYNQRFTNLNISAPLYHFETIRGTIEEKNGIGFINTDVDVVRTGEIYSGRYNGTTSNLETEALLPRENFTISVWSKVNMDIGTAYIIDIKTTRCYISFSNTGIHRSQLYDGSTILLTSSSVDLLSDTWYHSILTFDYTNKGLYWYLNGVLFDSDVDSGFTQIPATDNEIFIGCLSNKLVFTQGDIAGVKVWDQYVTAEQASQIYTSEKRKYNG